MVMFNYAYVSIWLNGKNLGKMDKFLSWRGSRTTNMAATTRTCAMNKIMTSLKNEYPKITKRGLNLELPYSTQNKIKRQWEYYTNI